MQNCNGRAICSNLSNGFSSLSNQTIYFTTTLLYRASEPNHGGLSVTTLKLVLKKLLCMSDASVGRYTVMCINCRALCPGSNSEINCRALCPGSNSEINCRALCPGSNSEINCRALCPGSNSEIHWITALIASFAGCYSIGQLLFLLLCCKSRVTCV